MTDPRSWAGPGGAILSGHGYPVPGAVPLIRHPKGVGRNLLSVEVRFDPPTPRIPRPHDPVEEGGIQDQPCIGRVFPSGDRLFDPVDVGLRLSFPKGGDPPEFEPTVLPGMKDQDRGDPVARPETIRLRFLKRLDLIAADRLFDKDVLAQEQILGKSGLAAGEDQKRKQQNRPSRHVHAVTERS